MAGITAKKLRETSPDEVIFTTGGTAFGLRDQVIFNRKLPQGASQPQTGLVIRVRRSKDVQVRDNADPAKTRVLPMVMEVRISIPKGVELAVATEAANQVVGAVSAQYGQLVQGLLPDQTFTFTPAAVFTA